MRAGGSSHPRLVTGLLLLLALAPAVFLLGIILRFGVNVPFGDQWEIAQLFTKIESHSLRLSDLTATHNESRIFFPRLLFIGLGYLTGWNTRAEMLVGFGLAVATVVHLYLVARATLGGPASRALVFLVPTSLLFLGVVQWENWIWGFDLVNLIPMCVLSAGLAVACSRLSPTTQVAVCAALATVATFSLFLGLLCWVLFPAALALLHRERIRSRPGLAVAWVAAAAVNWSVFFLGYRRPPGPSILENAKHPGRAIQYFLMFFGAPIGRGFGSTRVEAVSVLLGGLLLAWFLACFVCLLRRHADREVWRSSAPWLLIGAHALTGALLVTAVRSGYGLWQAASYRYATIAVPLIVANLFLTYVLLRGTADASGRLERAARAARVTTVLATAVVVLHVLTSVAVMPTIRARRSQCLGGKALISVIHFAPEWELLAEINYKLTDAIRNNVDALDRQGLLHPPLVKSDLVRRLVGATQDRPSGALESFSYSGDSFIALGWAVLPDRGGPADAVLLCYRTAGGGDDRVFAAAVVNLERSDVDCTAGNGDSGNCGFMAEVPRSRLPADAFAVSAWAFDALTNRAYPLGKATNAAPQP